MRLRPAADAKVLPQLEPWAVGKHLVMSSIGSRDVARAERPNVWRFEHFLELLNVADDAFNIHASPSSKKSRGRVNLFDD